MNWWEPWVGQGYNVMDIVREAHAGNLTQEQYDALNQYLVGGFGPDLSVFSGVEGDFSTIGTFTESGYDTFSQYGGSPATETELGMIPELTEGFGFYQSPQDWTGGGGVGGEKAKGLFYPGQQTGFAGVGKGIQGQSYGGSMQSTLDELLKNQGEK